jgi:hypothetical protein
MMKGKRFPLYIFALFADPPSRVGRLNLVDGQVSFRSGSLDDWGQAYLNYPVTLGEILSGPMWRRKLKFILAPRRLGWPPVSMSRF